MLPMAHCVAAKVFMIRSDFSAAHDHLERASAVAPRTASWAANVSLALMFRPAGHASQGAFSEAIADGAEALWRHRVRLRRTDPAAASSGIAGVEPPVAPTRTLRTAT
jgi:hypothetical protein